MTIKLQIITPEKIVYQDEVNQITAPTRNGEITVLPQHIGLLTQIVPGEIIVRKGETTHALAVTGGFMEVSQSSVNILADYAIRAEDIEVLKAQEAQRKAQKLMEEKISEKDYYYQECFWGKFSREIILPEEVDAEHAVATLKNGILTIRLPKLDRQKAKKLKVKLD